VLLEQGDSIESGLFFDLRPVIASQVKVIERG
jgi:hypothetical protein